MSDLGASPALITTVIVALVLGVIAILLAAAGVVTLCTWNASEFFTSPRAGT